MKKGFRIIKFKKDKPVFQIKDVSKTFDGRPILKKISMNLYPGECVGLLGPNGSGKSTLYSIIIGEIYADAGKIILNGKEIQDQPIHLRSKGGIGYLSQQRSVFDMSVYENLLGICQIVIKGETNQIKLTERLLDEFNLQHLRNIDAANLSGGEVRASNRSAFLCWYTFKLQSVRPCFIPLTPSYNSKFQPCLVPVSNARLAMLTLLG